MTTLDALTAQYLGSQAFARNTDPATSHAAAAAVMPSANRLGALILTQLASHPAGLTAREIAKHSGIDYASVTPRMKPLEAVGYVVRAAKSRSDFNHRHSTVWTITGQGVEYLAERHAKKSTETA